MSDSPTKPKTDYSTLRSCSQFNSNSSTTDIVRFSQNTGWSHTREWRQRCFGFDGTQRRYGTLTLLSRHGACWMGLTLLRSFCSFRQWCICHKSKGAISWGVPTLKIITRRESRIFISITISLSDRHWFLKERFSRRVLVSLITRSTQ